MNSNAETNVATRRDRTKNKSSSFIVIVSDKELARDVLLGYDNSYNGASYSSKSRKGHDSSGNYVKDGTAFLPSGEVVGNGMLVSDGALWRRQRRTAAPSFTRKAVREYATQVSKTAEKGVEELWGYIGRGTKSTGKDTKYNDSVGVDIDVYAGINELSLRAVMQCLFGLRDDTVEGEGNFDKRIMKGSIENRLRSAISDAFRCLTEINSTANLVPVWVPTPNKVKLATSIAALDEIVYALIRKKRRSLLKRKYSKKQIEMPSDLLSTLLDAFYESGDDDTVRRTEETASQLDKELRDELLTLLVAGQETSALTIRCDSPNIFFTHYDNHFRFVLE